MSTVYNLEPQPTAKVVLQTTSGDISIELFAKQTPLASRNFLQHCLDGYYNNTVFHRLVPGFIIQGGDPTGSGSGGISALNDGEPFQDEFHSRLKYNRRGLLGMANEGKDSNGSQFFFTLAATPELQGRNTLFGRVEGDTIYNLMKMADAELTEGEGSERPLYPTRITGAEILVNPFEDMVARAQEAPRQKAEVGTTKKQVKKRKKPLGKNVLSFGGEEGEEELAPVVKKAKVNPRFVAIDGNENQQPRSKDKPSSQSKDMEPEAASVQNTASPVIPKADETSTHAPKTSSNVSASNTQSRAVDNHNESDEDSEEDDRQRDRESQARTSALEKTNAEIAALKQSMKRSVDVQPTTKEKPKSALESLIPATSTRGRKRGTKGGNDELGALDLFKAFKSRLDGLPETKEPEKGDSRKADGHDAGQDVNGSGDGAKPSNATVPGDDEEAALCDLHFIPNCQSCKSWDTNDGAQEDDDDKDTAGWMAHKLSFAKDTLGKDLEWKRKMQEIEVIDPREKAREILGNRKKGKSKQDK